MPREYWIKESDPRTLQQRFSPEEVRAEMGRLVVVTMQQSAKYLQRERELVELYKGDNGLLQARLRDDIQLNNAAGASKTCASLAAGLATALMAEIEYERWLESHEDRIRKSGRESRRRESG